MSPTIVNIEERAFHNLPELRQLILQRNSIKDLHLDAFYNLPNLKVLDLSHNNISAFHNRTFSGLLNIQYLELRWNPLKKLQQNLFRGNIYNFLSVNSYLLFETDDMNCDTELFWIIEIFKNTKSFYRDLAINNKCWHSWDRQKLLALDDIERYCRFCG